MMGADLTVLEDDGASVSPLADILSVEVRGRRPGALPVRDPDLRHPLPPSLSPGAKDQARLPAVRMEGGVDEAVQFLAVGGQERLPEIGRAACRGRVEISVVAVSLK